MVQQVVNRQIFFVQLILFSKFKSKFKLNLWLFWVHCREHIQFHNKMQILLELNDLYHQLNDVCFQLRCMVFCLFQLQAFLLITFHKQVVLQMFVAELRQSQLDSLLPNTCLWLFYINNNLHYNPHQRI